MPKRKIELSVKERAKRLKIFIEEIKQRGGFRKCLIERYERELLELEEEIAADKLKAKKIKEKIKNEN